MLLQRRRQLGLTCEQASRILKLREDVLVAFEEGNFESMPQSGYAQGMLSSYARYLGLNAREVVDLFQEELYEYVNGSGSHELRRRTRDTIAGRGISGYDVVNEVGSRPKAYVEYHGLLPTAGGPAGDMGNFATVTPARPRQSVPLAGLGPSAVAAYGREDHAHQQPRQQRRQPHLFFQRIRAVIDPPDEYKQRKDHRKQHCHMGKQLQRTFSPFTAVKQPNDACDKPRSDA